MYEARARKQERGDKLKESRLDEWMDGVMSWMDARVTSKRLERGWDGKRHTDERHKRQSRDMKTSTRDKRTRQKKGEMRCMIERHERGLWIRVHVWMR